MVEAASYCAAEKKGCVGWVRDIFKDCLCNLNDEVSFVLGMATLSFWAVAEIPQIITNFNNKSAAGVSLAFLSTWILGDIFNLVGCVLEPSTLPTQFYTAVLYTTVTIVLALQCLYYNHFGKSEETQATLKIDDEEEGEAEGEDGTKRKKNVPIQIHVPHGHRRPFFFMSARSLTGSHTPPFQASSYIKATSGPPILGNHPSSSDDEDDEESLIPLDHANRPTSLPRSIPRPAGYAALAAAAVNLPNSSRALRVDHGPTVPGILLFQGNELQENVYGQWLGWLMAGIYTGGRISQICFNIKRGNVEGLNPLMFVLALMANATYVGSILVRSREWRVIKPNMPWLLDALVCIALDLFIVVQYMFYRYKKPNKDSHCQEYYVGADK